MHSVKILLDRSKTVDEHPCHSLLPVRITDEGLKVEIQACSMLDAGSGYSMIMIHDPSDALEPGGYRSECGEASIARMSKGHYMAFVTNHRCLLSSLINSSGCFLSSAVPVTDDLIEWRIIGPDSTRVHSLLARMRECGYSFHLLSSTTLAPDTVLTPRQSECFNMAMDLGYYDVPKRIGLDELSAIMGCSKSTLNVTLRTAERNIFSFFRDVNGLRKTRCEHVRMNPLMDTF